MAGRVGLAGQKLGVLSGGVDVDGEENQHGDGEDAGEQMQGKVVAGDAVGCPAGGRRCIGGIIICRRRFTTKATIGRL